MIKRAQRRDRDARCRALFVACIALVVHHGGCKEPRRVKPIKFGAARLLTKLDVKPTVAARATDGRTAVGTEAGHVLVLAAEASDASWITDREEAREPTVGQREPKADSANTPASRRAYDGPVTAIAFSAAGDRLLAAGGHRIAWWQVEPEVLLLAELVGPQVITAAVIAPDGDSALFGTEQGHLLRWTLDEREARPLAQLSCGALPVAPRRAKLVPKRRCPYGTHLELPTGRSICTYPLTHLAQRGELVARACRTGSVAVFRRGRAPHAHAQAGALGALAFLSEERTLFARQDGELRLYDLAEKRALRTMTSSERPLLVDHDPATDLIAVAAAGHLRLWREGGVAAGAVALPAKPVWLQLRSASLELMLANGKLVRWDLDARTAN